MSGSEKDSHKVSDEAFKNFTDAIDKTSSHFSANLRQLANVIATLDGGSWAGEAHRAFRQAQSDLNDEHDRVRRMIDRVREAVVLTHRASGATDAEIAAQMKGVDVTGGGSAPGGAGGSHNTPPQSKIDLL
ncbi:WXG100 family type VII secretion target [Streptomyces sp. VNUA116]|uniref:WXG100 family type VII secretion target n=1 Tax=Streptomyces sp. VNUA116 TaxID=3062449 RepID=UPI0026770714|nr:WXG100 family type VII secretion target [Streptomyces sp. VNUA116]WKU47330.1 WXG100 family type VII secretion target [Streptomyces sp. VNUA116]